MKTLIFGFPASFFVWGIVLFVYSFKVEHHGPEIDLTNERLEIMAETNKVIRMNCDVMQRRNEIGFEQLELIGREFELITRIDSVNIIYKIEIDSSVLKQKHGY